MKKHVAPTLIFSAILLVALVGLHLGFKNYVLLGSIMLIQNMTFTMASRARNSESLSYVAIAQLLANGTFILALGRMGERISTWQMQIFYCIMTTSGGTLMVYLSAKYIEKGARRVGGSLADRVNELERSLKALTTPCSACQGTREERSGVCHCGESMDGHSLYDNHSATEMTRPCPVCCDCKTYQHCQRLPEDPACTGFEKEGAI